MWHVLLSFLIMVPLGAFLWRLRGGLLNDLTGVANYKVLGIPFNDTVVRIIWSVGIAVPFWLLHPNVNYIFKSWLMAHTGCTWIGCTLFAVSLFAGVTAVGWGKTYSLLPPTLALAWPMGKSGFLRMWFPAVVLLSFWPLVAGLLFTITYWLGAKTTVGRKWEFWGEIYTGAEIGFIFSLI